MISPTCHGPKEECHRKNKVRLPFLCLTFDVSLKRLTAYLVSATSPAARVSKIGNGNVTPVPHLWRFEEHLPLVHSDLVSAGLWCPEEDYVLVLERLQRLGVPPLVHGHVLRTHAQPQVVWEPSFFTLGGFHTRAGTEQC